jgi:hypothetical protein
VVGANAAGPLGAFINSVLNTRGQGGTGAQWRCPPQHHQPTAKQAGPASG